MKKGIIVFTAILASLVGSYVYIDTHTERYVNGQSKSLCQWLNSKQVELKQKPRVGPEALKKLSAIKVNHSGKFRCVVEKSPHNYGYKYQQSIVIYQEKYPLLGLVYGFDLSGRNFLRSRYFQYWVPESS